MPREVVRLRRARTNRFGPSVEAMERRELLATLMVTDVQDSGPGSLRQAILDADAAQGASTIDFAIPGAGDHTIALQSALPDITSTITLDATTEPGYDGSPVVEIDGTNATQGDTALTFRYGSTGSTVRGLSIVGCEFAAIVDEGPQVTIDQNYLGVQPSGSPGPGNGAGVYLVGGNNSPSDDPAAGPGSVISGNVIGGNGDGLDLEPAVNTLVSDNYIGTDASGRTDLGNTNDGVYIQGIQATISGNTIANNGRLGIDNQQSIGTTITDNTLTNNGYLVANIGVAASTTSVTTSTGRIEQVTYTLTNQGPNTATSVVLRLVTQTFQEDFDLNFAPSPVIELAGAVTSQGTITPGVDLNNFASFGFAGIGTLAPGASASVTVAVLIAGSGTDSLEASASSNQPTTLPPGTTTNTTFTASGTADLSVTALPPPASRVGTPETLTFVVTNRDTHYAVGDARLALDFGSYPAPVTTGVLTSQGTVSTFAGGPSPNTYVGDLGALEPGASAVVTAVIVPTQPGRVGATLAAYSASDVDPNPLDNIAVAATIARYSPTVASTSFQPASGAITSLVIGFDAPLTASQAQDIRNYSLTTTNNNGRVAVRSAIYNAANRGVTLILARSIPRTGVPLKLVVGGTGTPGLTAVDGSGLLGGVYSTTLSRT